MKNADCPNVSINKLGEFIKASAGRRMQIVSNNVSPPVFITSYWSPVEAAFRSFLLKEDTKQDSDNPLRATYEKWRQINPGTEYQEHKRSNIMSALKAVEKVKQKLLLKNLVAVSAPRPCPKLIINGVYISVNPTVILKHSDSTNKIAGALKLHFPKNNQFKKGGGLYVATTLRVFLEEFYKEQCNIIPKACQVYDLGTERLSRSPETISSFRQEVETACNSYKKMWFEEKEKL